METTNLKPSSDYCNLCDISLNNRCRPGRGGGIMRSLLFLLPITKTSDYNKGYCSGRKFKRIGTLIQEYGFDAYITALVKCIGGNTPTEFEVDNCFTYHLRRELYEVKPKVIITVGALPTAQFKQFTSFKKIVDKPFVVKLNGEDVVVYPMANPSSDEVTDTTLVESFDNIGKLYRHFVGNNNTFGL